MKKDYQYELILIDFKKKIFIELYDKMHITSDEYLKCIEVLEKSESFIKSKSENKKEVMFPIIVDVSI